MTRADQKFFTEFRKNIMGDNTPINPIDVLEIPSLFSPGTEPRGSKASKEYLDLLEECKKKDAYIDKLEEQLKNKTTPEINTEDIKINAIRELVIEIIEYAKEFPCNQNHKADVIKEMLMAKAFNEHIPRKILTKELKDKINNLGRKEVSLQIGTLNAQNLYDVHNNGEVKL